MAALLIITQKAPDCKSSAQFDTLHDTLILRYLLLSRCNIQSNPGDCIIMSIYVSRTGLLDYDVGFFSDLVSDKRVQTDI